MYLVCILHLRYVPLWIHSRYAFQIVSRMYSVLVSGVVDVMDLIGPDGSPAFIGSHNQPGDEPL